MLKNNYLLSYEQWRRPLFLQNFRTFGATHQMQHDSHVERREPIGKLGPIGHAQAFLRDMSICLSHPTLQVVRALFGDSLLKTLGRMCTVLRPRGEGNLVHRLPEANFGKEKAECVDLILVVVPGPGLVRIRLSKVGMKVLDRDGLGLV